MYFHTLPNQRRNKKILELCKSSGTIFTSVNSQKVPALIPKISPCGQVHKSTGLYAPGHTVLEDPQISKSTPPQESQNWKKKAFLSSEQQVQKKSYFPPFHTLKSKSTLAIQKLIKLYLLSYYFR